MATEHRIIKVNDKDPKRTRRRNYRKSRKGDWVRISRATSRSVNETVQQYGISDDIRSGGIGTGDVSEEVILLDVRRGAGSINAGASQALDFPTLDQGGGLFSPEVQAVFDNMTDPLTDQEKDEIEVFVDSQVTSGNYA